MSNILYQSTQITTSTTVGTYLYRKLILKNTQLTVLVSELEEIFQNSSELFSYAVLGRLEGLVDCWVRYILLLIDNNVRYFFTFSNMPKIISVPVSVGLRSGSRSGSETI